MKGGVILFRGSGAAARRYVEADRSRADEYNLGADNAVAAYAVLDANGDTVHPAYVTLTGVLVEAFDTTADADGTFTVTLDPTDAIAPSGCLYAFTIGDADPILVNGDQGSGTVRGLRDGSLLAPEPVAPIVPVTAA